MLKNDVVHCYGCEHLSIASEPRWVCGDYFEPGRAICDKHHEQIGFAGKMDLEMRICNDEKDRHTARAMLSRLINKLCKRGEK